MVVFFDQVLEAEIFSADLLKRTEDLALFSSMRYPDNLILLITFYLNGSESRLYMLCITNYENYEDQTKREELSKSLALFIDIRGVKAKLFSRGSNTDIYSKIYDNLYYLSYVYN